MPQRNTKALAGVALRCARRQVATTAHGQKLAALDATTLDLLVEAICNAIINPLIDAIDYPEDIAFDPEDAIDCPLPAAVAQ